jgi:hypothetical protein
MEYSDQGNNFKDILGSSPELKNTLRRKAQIGADFWRANSVIDTGYNSQHVQVLESMGGPDNSVMTSVVYAWGYYAKWREIGSSRSGPRAPEWTLRRSIGVIASQ